jgi:DNA (cytosine-5)-methyltransferase 1
MELLEFFCGGGMARLGFGPTAVCVFANDIDEMKCEAYRTNFPGCNLREDDICSLSPADLPDEADLAWASSPCQDVSPAGHGAGLAGPRSSLVFAFVRLMAALAAEGRAPRMVIIENVFRLVTSQGGRDLADLVDALSAAGYRVGGLLADARLFLPQSRRRLFIVAVRDDVPVPAHLIASGAQKPWHPSSLERVVALLSPQARDHWIWWKLPLPAPRTSTLGDIIDAEPTGVVWDSATETERLLSMMSADNRAKIAAAQASRTPLVASVSRRTRAENDTSVQRFEPRFDGLAGCLLTPAGGASYPRMIVVDGASIRSRLLAPREAARLMGLPDRYQLPTRYRDAMQIIGDGVAIPVVAHLAECLVAPILSAAAWPTKLAA